jgi:AGZA family xanthine/uracil permease-like MFS transporter
MGVSWQTALGAVFLSGAAFLVLTLLGASRRIVDAMPRELYAAVAAGIGLFIAMLGLKNAGLISQNPATLVQLGNLRDPNALVAILGLLITAALQVRGVRGAMILGVLATTAVGAALGLVQWQPQSYGLGDLSATMGQLDLVGATKLGLLEVVFVFLFVDVFDNVGTLVGVTTKAGLVDSARNIPRIQRILMADSVATMVGAFAGTSTVVSYIESAAGVVAGGRSGVTAIVTGLMFLVALFVAPLVGAVPSAATAPALIVVGSLMMSHVGEIPWTNPAIAIPAFLAMVTIPLTASIATGLSLGFTAYALLKLVRGNVRREDWLVYLLAALFIARFVYLSAA